MTQVPQEQVPNSSVQLSEAEKQAAERAESMSARLITQVCGFKYQSKASSN